MAPDNQAAPHGMQKMMRKITYFMMIMTFLLFLSNCSSIDSLKPFDQHQAAELLKQEKIEKKIF